MRFIISTGGTGGHLFPALRVARELKGKGHDILFLGSFRRNREQIQKSGFAFEDLGSRGLRWRPLKDALGAIAAMAGAVGKAFRSLRAFRPDAVVGFGGYGAFPVMLSAVLLRYPTLIHEQNVVPGRANAILSKLVKRIAISFEKSARYFNPQKTVLTGCPCGLPKGNADRAAIFESFRLDQDKTTILVFGGSQGSGRINEALLKRRKP